MTIANATLADVQAWQALTPAQRMSVVRYIYSELPAIPEYQHVADTETWLLREMYSILDRSRN